jgi:hypothetical protein
MQGKHLIIAITLLTACIAKKNQPVAEESPRARSDEKISKMQEIKKLYATLADQLTKEGEGNPEATDIALAAGAIAKAPDEDVEAFLESEFVKTADEALQADTETDKPSLIGDDKTKYALISLITLGSVTLLGGLAGFKIARIRSMAALAIGITAAAYAIKYYKKPTEDIKQQAGNIFFASGIIWLSLGVAIVTSTFLTKKLANTPKGNDMVQDLLEKNNLFDDEAAELYKRYGFESLAGLVESAEGLAQRRDAVEKLVPLANKYSAQRYPSPLTVEQVMKMSSAQQLDIQEDVFHDVFPNTNNISDVQLKDEVVNNQLHDIFRKNYGTPHLNSRIKWGFVLAGFGAALLAIRQKTLKLTGSSALQTMQTINSRILSY